MQDLGRHISHFGLRDTTLLSSSVSVRFAGHENGFGATTRRGTSSAVRIDRRGRQRAIEEGEAH